MQPPVHLVVGYVCYAAYARWKTGDTPRAAPTLAAVGGAAVPDLIDQSLHALGLTPVTRTVGHSLLFAVPVIVVVGVLSGNRNRLALGTAFAIGYLSHVATDVPWHVLSGDYAELGFLAWPLTHMPDYSGVKPLGTLGGFEVTTLWLEAVIVGVGLTLWWRDGRPGLTAVVDRSR